MSPRLFSRIVLIVVLCAKEIRSHNRTYNHFIRINTWQDSDTSSTPVPLPITEFLAGRSTSSQASDDETNCAGEDLLCASKRQVDPLHSCIEAKCSRWNTGNYLDCVYRHCVTGFQLHGKRSTADDDDGDSFGHPAGRFLLVPLAFDSANVDPQTLLPELIRASSGGNNNAPATRVEARARLQARASLHARRRRNASSVWSKGRAVEALRRTGPLAAKLRAISLLPKRSYNDIADVCVEHHCGQMIPHSISYFQCVDHHCTGK